jgi:hypothetical protein
MNNERVLKADTPSATQDQDTQANFTRLASFIALTKSDTIQRVSRPSPSKSRFPPIPRAYFRFERSNAMNAMETIDGEPCICIE